MNWGMKIVIGLATFMLFIAGAGIYMVSHDSDSLIDEDYYEKGLTYDSVYDRKQNLLDDHAKPKIIVQNDTLVVVFATSGNSGEIAFKRPSDGSLDRTIPLLTTTTVFKLPVSTFAKGNWSLELTWESADKRYIDNQNLFIH